MRQLITAAMLRAAQRDNARLPNEERWSRLVRASGRLAKRIKRDGIEASELRDEKPKRTDDFGSELPTCRRHGSKGSTKPLPGRRPVSKPCAEVQLRDSMIRAGLIAPKVIKAADRPAMQVQGTLSLVR